MVYVYRYYVDFILFKCSCELLLQIQIDKTDMTDFKAKLFHY